ncbi:MAG: non-homologous end-joining DNA ligase [Deltaproteobacteria bacterium]|nr:non-homologous end-joining DNA ligase [Deltaproteobacteria bacterium]
MVDVSNADRLVFPEIGRTKGDVVAYYERIAPRLLPHVAGRPLSIKRFPKGLAAPGFFQKNVPPHYPASIERFAVPRSPEASKKHRGKGGNEADVTLYPVIREAEHLAYVANQGALELHVPTALAADLEHPDRLIIDLDPPPGRVDLARRAAHVVHDALAERGLASAPVATGSKGYHVVAPLTRSVNFENLFVTLQKFATLLATKHPDVLTVAFRIAQRGERVFLDWLRNSPISTVVAPYSLRARPLAPVATPLDWSELDTTAPDAFTIGDLERLLERPDSLRALAPSDPARFISSVDADFDAAGLELVPFDRFRS